MATDFDLARLAAMKTQLVALETSLVENVGKSGVVSYTYDSGQGRQTVTRSSYGELQKSYIALYDLVNVLSIRCGERPPAYARVLI